MQLGQGKEKARIYLKENPVLTAEIKDKILAAGGLDDLMSGGGSSEAESDDETPASEDF
jgi:recombination protein RecA